MISIIIGNIYNLTINILAINNLNILGNKYLDIINTNIVKDNIPKVNKCKKQKGTNCGINLN